VFSDKMDNLTTLKKEVSCGFVLYQQTKELRFLLLKLPRPNEWDFPKGHQNGSETFLETAQRELKEEVGMDFAKDILVIKKGKEPVSFEYEYKSPTNSSRKIVLFVASCKKNPIISSEHSVFVWVSPKEAKELVRFPETCACLDEIHSLVSNSNDRDGSGEKLISDGINNIS